MKADILIGDAIERLRDQADSFARCCVTSPPYWRLRDYGVAGQFGLEDSPEEYISRMVAVFREIRRVLSDDGTLWVNVGDSYAAGGKGGGGSYMLDRKDAAWAGKSKANGFNPAPSGMKAKDLVGIPWMLAFALRADGWYLRQDIIWSKPNPMPESVTDRCTKAHEYLFLMSKSSRYYFDAEAISEPRSTQRESHGNEPAESVKRNRRSVWEIATQPYSEAHFATYPEKLAEACILAGTKEGDTVIDPFCGSGTTGVVSLRHNRNFVGIELNPDYGVLAERRMKGAVPWFSCEDVTVDSIGRPCAG